MWIMSLPWWEFILRGIIVYFFLIVLLRLTGKRQIVRPGAPAGSKQCRAERDEWRR